MTSRRPSEPPSSDERRTLAPIDLPGSDRVLPIACAAAFLASVALAAAVYSLHHPNHSVAAKGMAVTQVSLRPSTPEQGSGSLYATAAAPAETSAPRDPAPAETETEAFVAPTPNSLAAIQPQAVDNFVEPPPTGAMRVGAVATAFQRSLESHLARFSRFPSVARDVFGVVQISFEMDRNGAVSEIRVASSSGHFLLDAEAINIIRRAAPLPAIPSELPSRLRIVRAFDFAPSTRSAF